MGLFGNKKELIVYSPVDGEVKELSKVADEAFQQEMLGKGLAIAPSSSNFYSPVEKGKMITVFPTFHAFGIKTIIGAEILIHIGLDTVELNGVGFASDLKSGDKINSLQTKIVTIELDQLKSKVKSMDTPVVITNYQDIDYKIEYIKKEGLVKAGEPIFKLVKK